MDNSAVASIDFTRPAIDFVIVKNQFLVTVLGVDSKTEQELYSVLMAGPNNRAKGVVDILSIKDGLRLGGHVKDHGDGIQVTFSSSDSARYFYHEVCARVDALDTNATLQDFNSMASVYTRLKKGIT